MGLLFDDIALLKIDEYHDGHGGTDYIEDRCDYHSSGYESPGFVAFVPSSFLQWRHYLGLHTPEIP